MKIDIIKVGTLKCNCYILTKDNNCIVIDPGDEFEKINPYIKDKIINAVIITHSHFDHINALNSIINTYNTKVYKDSNLEEKEYHLGPFTFNIIKTYGHSNDSITIYFKEDNIMFVGDFIFKESIGRCDLPTGNFIEMQSSINKIKKYNSNIIIYPGHGDKTTLGYELEHNPYF